MPVSVAQLCELKIFKEGFKLIAGHIGIHKHVQRITVGEVPDFTEFDLGKDLFVLTTFYAFSNSSSMIAQAVEKLCEKNISALAIKMDRYIDNVSPEIIQIANAHQLPLFLMSKDVAFRNAINDISTEIIDSQIKTISSLNQQYELLMESVLNGDKIESFIQTLGKSLNCYCACMSFSKDILAQYCPETMKEEQDAINDLREKLNILFSSATHNLTYEGFHVFQCNVYKQTMGYLIVRKVEPLTDSEILLIKQMVSFLSIKFLEQYLQFETEQRMIMTILDQVLFHSYSDESLLMDKLKLLGVKCKKHHFILIFLFPDEGVRNATQFALQKWNALLTDLFPNSAIVFKGGQIVAVISVSEKSPYTSETGIKRDLVGLLEKKNIKADNGIMIGCSTIVNNLLLLPECYQQAKKAIQFGQTSLVGPKIFFYSHFIEQGIISHSIGTHEHEMVTQKIIMPIKHYDTKYEADLWTTLEQCLFAKSLENAAADLHIHSSTLRYRLQRINDLTDVNFFSPHGNFLLKLAYVISTFDSNR